MWMLGAAVNGLVGAPVWVALNTDVGLFVTHLAALMTLGLGVMVCYGVGLLVATDAPELSRALVRSPRGVTPAREL